MIHSASAPVRHRAIASASAGHILYIFVHFTSDCICFMASTHAVSLVYTLLVFSPSPPNEIEAQSGSLLPLQVQRGDQHRAVRHTEMNQHSSRSHTILQVGPLHIIRPFLALHCWCLAFVSSFCYHSVYVRALCATKALSPATALAARAGCCVMSGCT